jgi:ABC-type polysaccharide/polyol phosphate transport system ATPase subunit
MFGKGRKRVGAEAQAGIAPLNKNRGIMSEIAISAQNISKVYKLYDRHIDRLKEAIHPFGKKYHRDFYALREVSFEVKKGETVGIIGKNGSGKSTLLQIIAGVLTQTSGHVTTNGKVSALLELGTGFNPEHTGVENIYFNGMLMGFSQEEMDSKMGDILSFADIGEFVNQQVKTYSSGMFVRLAFSVAINVDPDILIIDEALAVGDIRFTQKCFRKIEEFREKRKTILFVSHDPGTIIKFCSTSIWLKEGEIFQSGNPDDIVKKYVAYMIFNSETNEGGKNTSISPNEYENPGMNKIEWDDVSGCSSFGEGGAEIKRAALYSKNFQRKLNVLKGGEKVIFLVEIEAKIDILFPIVGFVLKDRLGNKITGCNSHIIGLNLDKFQQGEVKIVYFEFEFPHLTNGSYLFSPAIAEGTQCNHIQHHWVHDAYIVEVNSPDEAAKLDYKFALKNFDIKVE